MSHQILVVDDDADIRDTLVELLELEGFAAFGAGNGQEALEGLRRRPVALVLLDLMMPVMDGFEFRSRQLEDPALCRIPVVIVSAGGHCESAAEELGVHGWLRKPLDVRALLNMVRATCGSVAPAP